MAGLASALILFPAVVFAVAGAGLVVMMSSGPHAPYFPGDAPWAETAITFGGLACIPTLVALCISAVLARFSSRPRWLGRTRAGATVIAAVLVVSLAWPVTSIAARHLGQWRELRAVLLRAQETVLARSATARAGDQLSDAEYDELKFIFESQPMMFTFEDPPQTVVVRPMQSVRPYIGVEFGNGANAVFEPRTMWCVYAD